MVVFFCFFFLPYLSGYLFEVGKPQSIEEQVEVKDTVIQTSLKGTDNYTNESTRRCRNHQSAAFQIPSPKPDTCICKGSSLRLTEGAKDCIVV